MGKRCFPWDIMELYCDADVHNASVIAAFERELLRPMRRAGATETEKAGLAIALAPRTKGLLSSAAYL